MKRAAILALLADEMEATNSPGYQPLPGAVGVILSSMARDVLALELRPAEEISRASVAAVNRQADRYCRTQV